MNWQETEQKLPSVNQEQLIESLKMYLRLIERMKGELAEGARKRDEMTLARQPMSQPAAEV